MHSETKKDVKGIAFSTGLAGFLLFIVMPLMHNYFADQEHEEEFRRFAAAMSIEHEVGRFILGTVSPQGSKSSMVTCDLDGIVTEMNPRAYSDLSIKIGDQLESMMEEEEAIFHTEIYRLAMKSHANGKPVYTDVVCGLKNPDGDFDLHHVVAWTHIEGGTFFATQIDTDEFKLSPEALED